MCRLRMCVRLRRWRAMSERFSDALRPRPDLPSAAQSRALSEWLAGPRSRALRRAGIGRRSHVLEIGTGHGVVTSELQRRVRGTVTCLDIDPTALRGVSVAGILKVASCCTLLPFRDASFDLVFFQNTLLWVSQLQSAVQEAARVLQSDGALVAIEPDFGGMMEHPDLGLQDLWLQGLTAAGADPRIGRKLPGACEAAGLDTWVELAHIPQPAEVEAVRLLYDLPLDNGQLQRARAIADRIAAKRTQWSVFIHVPYFLIVATKPQQTNAAAPMQQ